MSAYNDYLEAPLWRRLFQRREAGAFIALAALVFYMAFKSEYFLGSENLFNILRNMSTITVMACGMTMIIVTGGIDLSIGSTLGVTGMLAARMMFKSETVFLTNHSPWIAIPAAILMGGLIGLGNGLIITKLKVNPFITTLGMLSIGRGLTYLLATGIKGAVASNIPMRDELVNYIGMGKIGWEGFEVPVQVIIMIILLAVCSLFLVYTVLGRQIYAVGANAEAARLTGVNVDNVQIFVYTLTGFLCALAGLMGAGLVGAAVTNAGSGNELDVIAAVIIGGTSLSGGEGTIVGAVFGAAIMAVLKNAFVLLHLPVYLQTVSIGVVIILAVAIDGLRRRRG
ncbi:MAG: ABC transporter permease [Planctomycetota bacterium]|jgi:ribose transport system permease protein|nr:ABC transporter permease [Planctomycetota bacterium]